VFLGKNRKVKLVTKSETPSAKGKHHHMHFAPTMHELEPSTVPLFSAGVIWNFFLPNQHFSMACFHLLHVQSLKSMECKAQPQHDMTTIILF
jgi:hypothetical protein